MKTALHAEVSGNPKNPPLVLLHGFLGSGQSFAPLIQRLCGRFFCAALDLPGHGRSLFSAMPENERPRSFSGAADMVLATLDGLTIHRFSLYGYSMGGRLAQAVNLAAPERVTRLILESAGFGMENAEERRKRYQDDLALLSEIETRADFRRFLERWHGSPLFCTLRGTPLLERLIESKTENRPEELRRALAVLSLGNHGYFPPLLAALDTPIAYLYGEKDSKYSRLGLSAAKLIPRLSLHPFAGASHDVHAQYPEKAAQIILGF